MNATDSSQSAAIASRHRILRGVLYGVTVLAPLILLLDPRVGFLRDWPVHVWIIDYYAEYFRQHGDLPTVINLTRAVGMPQPVFYGYLLYPMLGVLAAIMGTAAALRVALAAMLAVQFGAVLLAGRRILGHGGLAYTVAVALVWSTYSLTNLYHRGALAEYFGAGFHVIALAFGATAVTEPPGSARRFFGWLAGLFLLLAIGTHPPTAVLAGIFLVLLGGAFALGGGLKRWSWVRGDGKLIALAVVLGALVLAPWLYANFMFGGQMSITQSPAGFSFRPDHSDTFWGRFGPLPYDASSIEDGINTQGAPYLEAQVSVVLLILLLWNLELLRRLRQQVTAGAGPSVPARKVLWVAAAWFLFLAIFSISPWVAEHFRLLAPYIQYVYRLVSHCNAALFIGMLASGLLVARQAGYLRFQQQTGIIAAVALTTAVLGLVLKLQHAAAAEAGEERRGVSMVGGQTDIARDYEVPGMVRELSAAETKSAMSLEFSVGKAGPPFGRVAPLRLEASHAGWARTNVLVHPWLKLERDGKIVNREELAQVDLYLAVPLSAGPHELRVIWQPDARWFFLHQVSRMAFALTLLITAVWAARRLRQSLTLPIARAADPAP